MLALKSGCKVWRVCRGLEDVPVYAMHCASVCAPVYDICIVWQHLMPLPFLQACTDTDDQQ